VKPGMVMLTWTDDETDPQFERSAAAFDTLSRERDARGRLFEIVRIHQPGPLTMMPEECSGIELVEGTLPRRAGDRLAGSYVNSYIGNEIVVLPVFDDPHDDDAVAMYEQVFAPRRVITVPGREILLGGGNVHCITQQQPSGRRS
jgi:agmatine deiminase